MIPLGTAMLLTVLLVVGATLAWCYLNVTTSRPGEDRPNEACALTGAIPVIFVSIAVISGWIWFHAR